MKRVIQVYRDLGRVLSHPQAYGLGDRAPKTLVDALTEMRQNLREELLEQKQELSEDLLNRELSQDADKCVVTVRPASFAGHRRSQ